MARTGCWDLEQAIFEIRWGEKNQSIFMRNFDVADEGKYLTIDTAQGVFRWYPNHTYEKVSI